MGLHFLFCFTFFGGKGLWVCHTRRVQPHLESAIDKNQNWTETLGEKDWIDPLPNLSLCRLRPMGHVTCNTCVPFLAQIQSIKLTHRQLCRRGSKRRLLHEITSKCILAHRLKEKGSLLTYGENNTLATQDYYRDSVASPARFPLASG